jgi:hypothetical protein
VTILEAQVLSPKARALRIQALAGARGTLLQAESGGFAFELPVQLGQTPTLVADSNLKPEDFTDGVLYLPGTDLMYAYHEASDQPLAALRIHNRKTGLWHCHELAEEKAKELAAQAAAPVADPIVFNVVDHSSDDSDGDLIPDEIEEAETPREPERRQIGIPLKHGPNDLDVVALDEAGNASWTIIRAHALGDEPSKE